MADLAYNPKTGEAVRLEGGQWVPTQVAKNDKTGEVLAFDGADWSRVSAAPSKVGLGAQGFNDAIANLVGMPVDVVNWGLKQVGAGVDRPTLGSEWNKAALDYVATLPGRAADVVSTGSTAPLTESRTSRQTPRTAGERTAYGIGEGVGNVAGILAPASVIAQGAGSLGPVTRGVAAQMAQLPVSQVVGGAVGGGVSGATENPWLGLGAGLLTGVGAGAIEHAVSRPPTIPGRAPPVDTNPVPPQFRDVVLKTPSGKVDATGIWFLDGDKPVYANSGADALKKLFGDRAPEFGKYGVVSGKNVSGAPISVWFKPGEEDRARRVIELFKSAPAGRDATPQQIFNYHRENGLALGYDPAKADAYARIKAGLDRAAVPAMTREDKAAASMLAKTLARDQKSVPQAFEDVSALGPDAMLADVAGRNMKGKVRMIANAPGEGANVAERALIARKAGEGSRVESLASTLAGPKRAAATTDDLIAQRAAQSAPAYEKAFASGPVTSDRVRQFLDDPIFKQGLRKGIEIQRLESLATGKPFNPKDYAITGFSEAGDPILGQTPNMRLLDAAKRGLDDILEGYRDTTSGRLALDQRGRAIDAVRRSFLTELDSLNADYKTARATWAGPSAAMDAISRGKQALSGSTDPYALAKQYKALSAADKEMFRVGAADWIRKTAGEAKTGSAAQRVFGDTRATLNNQAERLKIIFGDDFAKIRQLAEQEAVFNQTLKTLSVSPTKPLADESADVMGMLRSGMSAARGSPSGIVELLARAGRGAQARFAVGPEEVQAAAAKMLFASTPAEKERAARMLAEVIAMQQMQGGGSRLSPLAVYGTPQAVGAVNRSREGYR